MQKELDALRREVAQLRREIDATDDWANGIQHLLISVLPHLLRGHPEVEKVHGLLRSAAERYEAQQAKPPRRGKALQHWRQLEARKMAYHLFALLGVWPGVDSAQAAEESLDRARARARSPLPD